MARSDIAGFFWNDTPPPKPPKKEKPKATPPDRFWESPDYLPGLEEARAWVPNLYTDLELWQASEQRGKLLFDIEVYPNYCLFAFKALATGKVVYLELRSGEKWDQRTVQKLHWILHNFIIVNFNGLNYDFPVTTLALAGKSTEAMWDATCMLIQMQLQPKAVYSKYKTKALKGVNQIDLIELTALGPGLKVCAGRLHAPKLQDLPFKPGTILTEDQITILRRYCINDLDNTGILHDATIKQIELREKMGLRFGVDLRSKSDAQMAEAIISADIKRITGRKHIQRTTLPPGTSYRFSVPQFIKYSTPLMNWVLDTIRGAEFKVDELQGNVIMPPELDDLVIEMGKCKYKIGIGGLHSQEKSIAHVADDEYFIADIDATSYYPYLILNAGIMPENLGRDFLVVYNGIVVERVNAKQAGDIIVAECLKIVTNGTFGKLGSMWSIMYAPNLMIQTTVTGQLSILMLAERFELAGIEVTSVNTDGIVVKCRRSMEAVFNEIVRQWERETGFSTEEVRYKATYSRDINNYIAVYEEPQKGQLFKTKGAYGKTSPKKNAVMEICVDAVKAFIATGVPLIETISACRDIRRFTSMRAVAGGAVKGYEYNYIQVGNEKVRAGVKNGIFLGKLIRWYYSTAADGEIVYAKTGNKVALSDGAMPCMDLPEEFPLDIDYEKYVAEAQKILTKIGYFQGVKIDEESDEKELIEDEV